MSLFIYLFIHSPTHPLICLFIYRFYLLRSVHFPERMARLRAPVVRISPRPVVFHRNREFQPPRKLRLSVVWTGRGKCVKRGLVFLFCCVVLWCVVCACVSLFPVFLCLHVRDGNAVCLLSFLALFHFCSSKTDTSSTAQTSNRCKRTDFQMHSGESFSNKQLHIFSFFILRFCTITHLTFWKHYS